MTPAVPAETLDLLENLNSLSPLSPGSERIVRDDCTIWLGDHRKFGLAEPIPQLTVVQRLRIEPGEVEQTVSQVRALLRERGRPSATWEVGPSARPADVADRLGALGMVPDSAEPEVAGLVLSGDLPAAPPGVQVRRVQSVEDRIAYRRIFAAGFGHDIASEEELRTAAADAHDDPDAPSYLASIDGEPVAAGSSLLMPAGAMLNGAATLEHARGRGAFRALVAARMADARARGIEAGIVQAGRMSLPILERTGFVRVLTIRVFLDEPVVDLPG